MIVLSDLNKKESFIKFRIDADLKERFQKKCQENAQNSSELMRRYIKDFIENKR